MAKVVRLSYHSEGGGRGLLNTVAAVLVPCCEEAARPRMALTRAGLGDKWRTKTVWHVVAGINDGIRIDIGGGPLATTIAAGTYTTGAALAVAIDTALTALVPPFSWTVDYNVTAANKFTIAATGSFALLFDSSTAANANSIHRCLGFADGDTASAASHTATGTSYGSRHWLNVDLGSAQAFTATIVGGHNLTSAGAVTLQADAASLAAVGLLDTATPDFSQALAGTADPRVAFFASQSKRYLRVILDDVSNPAGYLEVALCFVGTYVAPTRLQGNGRVREPEHLSEIVTAIGGAHQQIRKEIRNAWSLTWKLFTQAEEDLWDAVNEAVRIGGSLYLTFDASAPTTTTIYGHFRRGPRFDYGEGEVRSMSLLFVETLP